MELPTYYGSSSSNNSPAVDDGLLSRMARISSSSLGSLSRWSSMAMVTMASGGGAGLSPTSPADSWDLPFTSSSSSTARVCRVCQPEMYDALGNSAPIASAASSCVCHGRKASAAGLGSSAYHWAAQSPARASSWRSLGGRMWESATMASTASLLSSLAPLPPHEFSDDGLDTGASDQAAHTASLAQTLVQATRRSHYYLTRSDANSTLLPL